MKCSYMLLYESHISLLRLFSFQFYAFFSIYTLNHAGSLPYPLSLRIYNTFNTPWTQFWRFWLSVSRIYIVLNWHFHFEILVHLFTFCDRFSFIFSWLNDPTLCTSYSPFSGHDQCKWNKITVSASGSHVPLVNVERKVVRILNSGVFHVQDVYVSKLQSYSPSHSFTWSNSWDHRCVDNIFVINMIWSPSFHLHHSVF